MANPVDWITAAIDSARQQVVNAPEAVWTELKDLLTGKLRQKPLPGGELATIAMQLIEKTDTTDVKAEKP